MDTALSLQKSWLLVNLFFHPDAHAHLLKVPIRFRGEHWQDFVNVLGEEEACWLAAEVEVEEWFSATPRPLLAPSN